MSRFLALVLLVLASGCAGLSDNRVCVIGHDGDVVCHQVDQVDGKDGE